MPMMKLAKPTPNTSDTTNEPVAAIQSKVLRQRASGCLARYSKATPRMMRPTRMRKNGT